MLDNQDPNYLRGRSQRNSQPRRRGGAAPFHNALLRAIAFEFLCQQQGLTGAHHVTGKAFATAARLGYRIELVDPEFKMHQIGSRIGESYKAVVSVEYFFQRIVNSLKQVIKAGRDINTLDNLNNDLVLDFGPGFSRGTPGGQNRGVAFSKNRLVQESFHVQQISLFLAFATSGISRDQT